MTKEPKAEQTAKPAKEAKTRAPAPAPDFRCGRIALVGRPNVGKSTLLNALLGEPIAIVSRHPQTTRDQIAGVVSVPGAQLVFLDTPGIHNPRSKLGVHMNDVAWDTAKEADLIVFLAEASDDLPRAIRAEDKQLLGKMPANKPMLLALNKIDLIRDKSRLLPVLERWGSLRDFAAIVPVSAKKANGTARLIKEVAGRLPLGEPLFEGDEISDKPARFFVAEFVREQILRKTFQEVPHGVAVLIERFDESGKIPIIEVAVHVQREMHKRIVIGSKGELLKAIGTEARARAEALLGTQVHLKIWVRVTPDWQESDARLKDFGYQT